MGKGIAIVLRRCYDALTKASYLAIRINSYAGFPAPGVASILSDYSCLNVTLFFDLSRSESKPPAEGRVMGYYNTFVLSPREYAKICGEINTYYSKYERKKYAIHASYGIDNVAYWYFFENYGYNNYNIYMRIAI